MKGTSLPAVAEHVLESEKFKPQSELDVLSYHSLPTSGHNKMGVTTHSYFLFVQKVS